MSDKCNCDSSVTSVTSVTECAKCRYLQASGTQVGNHSWDTRVTPAHAPGDTRATIVSTIHRRKERR